MNDHRVFDVIFLHVLLAQEHVRARLSRKCEAPVSVRGKRDKCHGRDRFFTESVLQPFDVISVERVRKEMAEVVIAQAAQHAGLEAVSRDSAGHVGRRAARISDVAGFFCPRDEIDDHLTDTKQIQHSASFSAAGCFGFRSNYLVFSLYYLTKKKNFYETPYRKIKLVSLVKSPNFLC